MKTRGRWGWWVLVAACGAAACGQELALPTGDAAKTPVADAAADGTTGASGAPTDTSNDARLPVADMPIFTTFGGVGGDETGGAGDEVITNGGVGGHGGSAAIAGSGGQGGNGSGAGSGGRAAAGGSAGAAGTQSSGGAGAEPAEEAGAGGSAGAVSAGLPALLFSEYVEGSGSLKALEIYALAASSLEGCELQTYFNGKLEPSRLALHGLLGQGGVQVLCSSGLVTVQPSICDRSTSLTFNGDDALALSCGGVLLDVIGQIGVDPGEAWGQGATADHTLRRRCSVTVGRIDGSQPFDPASEWLVFGVDTFSDLGAHDCTE